MSKVDETIEALCDWIKGEVECGSVVEGNFSSAIYALALLVFASAYKDAQR